MQMTIKQFIENVLIKEIQQIQDYGHHYFSFLLIASGIEFLGACLDDKLFHTKDQSSERFKKAIKELFPKTYHSYADRLYSDLRCGLAHVSKPNRGIGLTHQDEAAKFKTKHLQKTNTDQLILISEEFFEDFKRACNTVLNRSEKDLTKPFLAIPEESELKRSAKDIEAALIGTYSPSASGCGLEEDDIPENLKKIWSSGGPPTDVRFKKSTK